MSKPKPKITRLPRNGPKPGQSMRSWLQGKSQSDRQWQRRIDENIDKLVFRRARTTQSPPGTGA